MNSIRVRGFMATGVIGRHGDRRSDNLYLLRHGRHHFRLGLCGIRSYIISGGSVQSSTSELARSHPWRGLFLLNPLADRANLAGRLRPRGCASPPRTAGLWLGVPGGHPPPAGGHRFAGPALCPRPRGNENESVLHCHPLDHAGLRDADLFLPFGTASILPRTNVSS